jgi:hypothetical protein
VPGNAGAVRGGTQGDEILNFKGILRTVPEGQVPDFRIFPLSFLPHAQFQV